MQVTFGKWLQFSDKARMIFATDALVPFVAAEPPTTGQTMPAP